MNLGRGVLRSLNDDTKAMVKSEVLFHSPGLKRSDPNGYFKGQGQSLLNKIKIPAQRSYLMFI